MKEWNNFCICDKGFVCRSKNLKCHLAFISTLSYVQRFEERPIQRREGVGTCLASSILKTSVSCARALSTTERSCGRAQHFSNAIYKRISQCVKVGFLAKISRISPTVLCSVQLISKISGKQDICSRVFLISDFCLNLRADVPSLEVPAGPRRVLSALGPAQGAGHVRCRGAAVAGRAGV